MSEFIASLEEKLPAVIARKQVGSLTGGILHPKTMANLDSLGQGPDKRWRLGRTVFYERDSFIKWLRSRIKEPQSRRTLPNPGTNGITRATELLRLMP